MKVQIDTTAVVSLPTNPKTLIDAVRDRDIKPIVDAIDLVDFEYDVERV